MPFFSVIIPLYNKENFIENTLQSVFNQEFYDFEILVVNDCSTDTSLEKVMALSHPKIKIIEHSKNKGLSASRNTGIKAATANYLAFLDADDIWHPTFLNEIHSLIEHYPEASIYGTNYEEINSKGKQQAIKKNTFFKDDNTYLVKNFFSINLQQPVYCPSSVAYDKMVFENSGVYDENITYAEDVDFNIRSNTNNILAYSNKVCVSYLLLSENQITTSSIENKTIPNFNKYESICNNENQLKKYLDFNRYVMARLYKKSKLKKEFIALKNGIDYKNLTLKQQLLLESPSVLTNMISSLKHLLLKYNIKIASYD
jgi:glycosyltransferase involved in cell wall biosynthesis